MKALVRRIMCLLLAVELEGRSEWTWGFEQKNAFHFIYCVLLFTKLHIVAGYAA